MKKCGILFLGVVLIIELIIGINVNYPPSSEQLLLPFSANLSRILFFTLFTATLLGWYRVVRFHFSENIALFSVWAVALSPMSFGLWLLHPWEGLKLFLIVWGIYLLRKFKLNWKWIGLLTIILFLVNYFQYFDKARIFSVLNVKSTQEEINLRLINEDTLSFKIDLPLWWRRASYNKYSLSMRSVLREFISFWNLETFFFQEITPSGQKSLTMFYWPVVMMFVLGIYHIYRKKDKSLPLVYFLFYLAFLNYIFSTGAENWRWLLCLLPISLLVAYGYESLIKYRFWLVLFIFLSLYGFQAFFYDFSKRHDYWLDNRPYVYEHFFNYFKKMDLKESDLIIVTDRVGRSKEYCYYYLGEKCDQNFIFDSFNLYEKPGFKYTYYAGFIGEFVGPDFNNNFPPDVILRIEFLGLKVIDQYKLRDSIAYSYGDTIIISKVNEKEIK